MLYEEMRKLGAGKEFERCAYVARSMAREFHDPIAGSLEQIAAEYNNDPGVLKMSYHEFKNFYGKYRHAA